MRKQTEEMIKVINEAFDYYVKQEFSSANALDTLSRLTPEQIKAFDMINRSLKTTKDYMLEYADQIDRIEQKLDLLLELESNKGKEATP